MKKKLFFLMMVVSTGCATGRSVQIASNGRGLDRTPSGSFPVESAARGIGSYYAYFDTDQVYSLEQTGKDLYSIEIKKVYSLNNGINGAIDTGVPAVLTNVPEGCALMIQESLFHYSAIPTKINLMVHFPNKTEAHKSIKEFNSCKISRTD